MSVNVRERRQLCPNWESVGLHYRFMGLGIGGGSWYDCRVAFERETEQKGESVKLRGGGFGEGR